MSAPQPLRGRTEPLGRALAVLRRARQHDSGGLLLITGPAGIGKTALLAETIRQARAMSYRVGSSKCDAIEQIWPAAPVVAALRQGREPLLAAADYEQVHRLAEQPLLLAERVAAHLEQVAEHGPLMIAVDDVQWADRVSRFVLRTVLARSVGLPIVLALAGRDPAIASGMALPETDAVEHLSLDPLGFADVIAVARDRLGRMPDECTSRLLRTADGNPFLIMQLIEGPLGTAGPAAGLAVTVHNRLLALDQSAAAVVRLIAVAGRPVPLADLPSLCGSVDAGALSQAVASGLVDARDGTLTFRHDLVREAVYTGIGDAERRRLHQRLATYLITAGSDLLAVAAHARAAACVGDTASAHVLLQAAEKLAAVSAEDAGELAMLAFRVLRPAHPRWLTVGRRCLAVLARTQRAADALALADVLLARVDDGDLAGQIETDIARALWLAGRPDQLIERIDGGLRRRTKLQPAVAARLTSARALARTRTTVGAIAAAEASAALDHARTVADTEALELALQAAGEAAKNEGRHHDALRHFRELRARSGASYLAEEIMALQLADRYDHAQALLQHAHADDAGHIETALPSLLYAQLWQDFNLGRLDEAEAGAQTLIDLGQQIGTNMHALEAIMIRSAVSVLRGDPTTAALRLQAAATLTSADDNIRLPGLTLMRGWLAAVNGDIETALSTLRPMLFTARESRTYWAWWPGWMSVFFHIGLAAGDADFAAEAVAIAELGAERNPGVASFEGLALNLSARLDADLGQLADAAKMLQTSPRPALRALGAETYGHALLAAGDRKAALLQLDQAWDEYDHMGAWAGRSGVQRLMREAGARPEKWTANPEATKTGWPSLSEAERRVAALIAAGHTNKSAAKTLGVSVNTVGTQLRSIFAKLGIQSRVQLANSLHENSASRPV